MRDIKLPVDCPIEVTSCDSGFLGSWYEATVVKPLVKGIYKIKYKNLMEDDMKTPCIEDVEKKLVRPVPPILTEDDPDSWQPGHNVEALWEDGWWQGIIDSRPSNEKFRVYFHYSAEHIDIPVTDLRTRQEWIAGKWTGLSEPSLPNDTILVDSNSSPGPAKAACEKQLESNIGMLPPLHTPSKKRKNMISLIPISSPGVDEAVRGECKRMRCDNENNVRAGPTYDSGSQQKAVQQPPDVQQPCTPSDSPGLPANQQRQRYFTHSGKMVSPVSHSQWAAKEAFDVSKDTSNRAVSDAASHAYAAVLRAFHLEGSPLDFSKLKVMADLRLSLGIPNSYHVELLQSLANNPVATCCHRTDGSINYADSPD